MSKTVLWRRIIPFLGVVFLYNFVGWSWLAAGRGLAHPSEVTLQTRSGGYPIGNPFKLSFEGTDVTLPSVAYDSQHNFYEAIWETGPNGPPPFIQVIWGRMVTPDLIYSNLLGNYGYSTGPMYNADITYNSTSDKALVVWEEDQSSHRQIFASTGHVSPNGSNQAKFALGAWPGVRDRYHPAAAASSISDSYMVVWESLVQASGTSDIEAAYISGDGLHTANFLVDTGDNNYSHDQPDIAYLWAKNQYLVAWSRLDKNTGDRAIVGRRLAVDGYFIDTDPIVFISDRSTNPSVAAVSVVTNIGGWAVAWEYRWSDDESDHDIYARVLSSAGGLNPTSTIEGSNDNQIEPAIAGNETSQVFLVSWTQPDLGGFNQRIYARTCSLSGAPMGEAQMIGGIWASHSAIDSGPLGDFLVVYQDVPFFGNIDIWGRFWGYRNYLPVALQ